MKKAIPYLMTLALLIFGLMVGYFIGEGKGFKAGCEQTKRMMQVRSMEELRNDLMSRESQSIIDYLKAKAQLEKKDEGSLFTTKYVHYLNGSISNSAALATAKDLKLRINYLSDSGSEIGSQEISLSEYVKAGQVVNFRQQVSVPANFAKFSFQLIDAKSY